MSDVEHLAGDGERPTLSRVAWHPQIACGPSPCEQAIELLDPPPPPEGRRAAVLTLLGWRVTWSAVKHWKKGRRAMPQWARELLIEAMETRVSELLSAINALKKKPGS